MLNNQQIYTDSTQCQDGDKDEDWYVKQKRAWNTQCRSKNTVTEYSTPCATFYLYFLTMTTLFRIMEIMQQDKIYYLTVLSLWHTGYGQ